MVHCILSYSGFIHCLIQRGAEISLELCKVVRKGQPKLKKNNKFTLSSVAETYPKYRVNKIR